MEHDRMSQHSFLPALRLTAREEGALVTALMVQDRPAVADLAATTLRRVAEMTAATEQLLFAAGWGRTAVSLFLVGVRDEDL